MKPWAFLKNKVKTMKCDSSSLRERVEQQQAYISELEAILRQRQADILGLELQISVERGQHAENLRDLGERLLMVIDDEVEEEEGRDPSEVTSVQQVS